MTAPREKLDLGFGVTDVPLVLQERRFTEAGELAYQPLPDEIEAGLAGDTVLGHCMMPARRTAAMR